MTFFPDTRKAASSLKSHIETPSLQNPLSLPPPHPVTDRNVGHHRVPASGLHHRPPGADVSGRFDASPPPAGGTSCLHFAPQPSQYTLANTALVAPRQRALLPQAEISFSPGYFSRPAAPRLRAKPAPTRNFGVPYPFAPISIGSMGRQRKTQNGCRAGPLEEGLPSEHASLPGEYVCHHEDCRRRFVRKTALTNHLKAHLNVKSRSIYRTKRARLRAAAEAELKAFHGSQQDIAVPQLFLPSPPNHNPDVGRLARADFGDRAQAFPRPISLPESAVLSDVTAAGIEYVQHQQFQGHAAPAFDPHKDRFSSAVGYPHDMMHAGPTRPGWLGTANEIPFAASHNQGRPSFHPASPATLDDDCPSLETEIVSHTESRKATVSYSREASSVLVESSEHLALGLDLSAGSEPMNDSWLYPGSNFESVSPGEFSGGRMSTQAMSSESDGPGDASDFNFTANRTGDQRVISSTDLSAGGIFSPVCSRSAPIETFSHGPADGELFLQEKRAVSEQVGSPMDDMFGESLVVPFDCFTSF